MVIQFWARENTGGVHQEPRQEKAGGTMKTASTWKKLAKKWQLDEYNYK